MGINLALSYDDAKRAADMIAQGMKNQDVCAMVFVTEPALIRALRRYGLYVRRKAGNPRKKAATCAK